MGGNITVPDGGHGDDRPVDAARDAGEAIRLTFDEVHEGAEDHHQGQLDVLNANDDVQLNVLNADVDVQLNAHADGVAVDMNNVQLATHADVDMQLITRESGVDVKVNNMHVVDADVDVEKVRDNVVQKVTGVNAGTVNVNTVNSTKRDMHSDDWYAEFIVNGQSLRLEIDTAAHCNVISLKTVQKLGFEGKILASHILINGVHNEAKRAYGSVSLPCTYRGRACNLNFEVLDSARDVNLLGRPDSVRLNLVARVNSVALNSSCDVIMKQYSDVLGQEIGCIPGSYDIKIDTDATPVVHPPRSVPAAIRDQVKKELDHLEKCQIIARVTEPTDWVNSMVVVRKKNGRVRICIDPTDLNKAIRREHYPMSTIEDIATRLHGSRIFSTLDANSGYFQVKLSDQSSHLTTFNTPFGRYRYLRVPMGLKCSAEVFQEKMQTLFGDIEGVEIVVDDILVHGKDEAEHSHRLLQVLERARKLGLKLNKEKSHIGMEEVNYVGHRLTGSGLKPTQERIEAISKMRAPENHQELETILGMIAYVSKFIPGLSEMNAPLRELKKRSEWHWSDKEQKSLDAIKKVLTSNPVLQYYDVKKPVVLTVDSSSHGLGAALIQNDSVVAYASRALTDTEQRYAQIEKEALAVVFACTKFHKMIYGKTFTVESDHKPLESIMTKPIHKAPMRIQRMLLKLQPYTFKLVHIRGKSLGLADCLSRLHQGPSEALMDDEMMVCPVDTVVCSQHSKFVEATKEDDELQQLRRVILTGWPKSKQKVPPAVSPYWDFRDELSTYNDLLFRGNRVIVPKSLQGEMVKLLHQSHMGMVLMKRRARDVMFWNGMNSLIDELVSKCDTCLRHRNNQPKEPMMMHPIPDRPWSKVGADIFELNGKHYLLLVDYYSNFVEVEKLDSLTTSGVIQMMKRNIARYGIMDTLVSDNGPQFASREFAEFASIYGVSHNTSSPLRAQSNGLAERSIQTVKKLMLKCSEAGEDFYMALLDLRNTPRDPLIGSPAQRLMGRRTQTRIPTSEALLKPTTIEPSVVSNGLKKYRLTQKKYYDRGKRHLPAIRSNDAVRVRTPRGWQPVEYVAKHQLPRSHLVKSGDQYRQSRRNRDQLLLTQETPHEVTPATPPPPLPLQRVPRTADRTPLAQQEPVSQEADLRSSREIIRRTSEESNNYSRVGRSRKPPKWLNDYQRY